MQRKFFWLSSIVLTAILAGIAWRHFSAEEPPKYRFATIERGNLEAVVSATGTVNPLISVQVGTQVSGQISAIFADFNDEVRKGQLIARIDPILLQQAVTDAQAGLERSRAEEARASRDLRRSEEMYQRKLISDVDFENARYAYQVAQANLKSAQVALDRARQNLDYTSIYAPIDGVIVERSVNVGQTVASNYATPQLFLIAKDLSQMQILAAVDESDIGQIRAGQEVRFSVQAYPNVTFTGTVSQVRLQSTVTENVVNYTVAIGVQNPQGKLLPGMTATIEFLTGKAQNALLVPNAALRYRQPAKKRVLWFVDDRQQAVSAAVQTGISDGQKTVVVGSDLKPDMPVIIGVLQSDAENRGLLVPPPGPLPSPGRR